MNIPQFFRRFDRLQLTIIVVLFLAFLSIIFQQRKSYVGGILGARDNDTSKQPTSTPSPSATSTPTTAAVSPTLTVAPTTNPTPTVSQTSSSDLIYPGAIITSSDNGSIRLESSDSPDTVTPWY